MPPNYNLKPETALAKAQELIRVGKKNIALEILFEIMKSRRARIWQKKLEELMLLFTDLCVELKKNQHFRRIIHQYRNITIQECPHSLEEVLRHYLEAIKNKTVEAKKQSKDAVPYVEDLEVLETPESLMLSSVSVEGAQDRSDRTILMPWIKFLWESYKISLELLKNSVKFEKIYHEVARETYEFCKQYNRKVEFRKLAEMLRQHTSKLQSPMMITLNAVNLKNPETQALHFCTRLQQLETAMDLEMYMEAYKTVEDIWNFILISKKVSEPVLMVSFYSKTAELFLRSGCHLFHAAALHKLLGLYRDFKKTATREELVNLSAQVVCATLSVPLPHVRMHFDKFPVAGEQNMTKQKTLASLLSLSQVPTRASLIRDMVRNRLPQMCCPELMQLYSAMEVDFQPLKLAERVAPALTMLQEQKKQRQEELENQKAKEAAGEVDNDEKTDKEKAKDKKALVTAGSTAPNLSVYLNQLYEVLASKTLLQLSQVYRTLSISSLTQLCPYMEPLRLERCVVELIHNLELPIRIDHRREAIIFDMYTDLGISQKQYGSQGAAQVGAPDQLSRQLVLFAQALHSVTDMLDSSVHFSGNAATANKSSNAVALPTQPSAKEIEFSQRRTELVQDLKENASKDREALMMRRYWIEDRKEELERIRANRFRAQEEEEARLRAERERIAADEQMRLAKEAEEREQDKTKEKEAKLKQRIASRNIKIVMGSGLADNIDPEKLTENFDQVWEKKVQELEKKRRDLHDKARKRSQKLDYLTRAIRLEEIPILKENAVEEAKNARIQHTQLQKEIEDAAKLEHEKRVADRQRMTRMIADVNAYRERLKESCQTNYEKKLSEWEAKCEKVRNDRLEVIRQRQEEEAKRALCVDEALAAGKTGAEESGNAGGEPAPSLGFGRRGEGTTAISSPAFAASKFSGDQKEIDGGPIRSGGFKRGGNEIEARAKEPFGPRRIAEGNSSMNPRGSEEAKATPSVGVWRRGMGKSLISPQTPEKNSASNEDTSVTSQNQPEAPNTAQKEESFGGGEWRTSTGGRSIANNTPSQGGNPGFGSGGFERRGPMGAGGGFGQRGPPTGGGFGQKGSNAFGGQAAGGGFQRGRVIDARPQEGANKQSGQFSRMGFRKQQQT